MGGVKLYADTLFSEISFKRKCRYIQYNADVIQII